MRSSVYRASVFAVLPILFLAPLSAFSATLFLTPSEGTHYRGENFDVGVLVSSDTSVNAFSGIISFPTDTLDMISVSRSNSIVDLWTQNPSFSNAGSLGNVRFEGVTLSPGFIGSSGKIITLTFRVKKEGSANLIFSKYAVLENDGFGTSAFTTVRGAYFTLLPSRPGTPESGTLPNVREVVVVKEVEISRGILNAWNFLPEWIQISILSIVGLSTILLALLIFSFGVVILIWLWGHLRERESEITRWFRASQTLVKNFFMAIPVLLGLAEKEVREDIKYSMNQVQENIREAKNHTPLSKVLYDFWLSIGRIIKRFFTRNNATTKEITDEQTETNEITDNYPESR